MIWNADISTQLSERMRLGVSVRNPGYLPAPPRPKNMSFILV